MPTRPVTLTNTPQLITAKAAYMESQGGDFYFVFSATTPASVTAIIKTESSMWMAL